MIHHSVVETVCPYMRKQAMLLTTKNSEPRLLGKNGNVALDLHSHKSILMAVQGFGLSRHVPTIRGKRIHIQSKGKKNL